MDSTEPSPARRQSSSPEEPGAESNARLAAHGSTDPLAWIDDELNRLEKGHLRRALQERSGAQSAVIHCDGKPLVNFASNDYLALAADSRLAEAARRAIASEGWGAGASPLISGHTASHARLAEHLAEFLGTEAALIFPSGFAANTGTIPALVGRGDAVLADSKNHASLIDGCRLSRAEVFIYPHNDCGALRELLRTASTFRRRLIVSDTLFSMDGDRALLADLAELARRHDAMLLVDEAHATGVFGPRGTGLVEEEGIADGVHIRIGTLSKALGSAGGFVAGQHRLIEWLTNRARPYVFSTAHPAAVSAAALAALELVRDEPWRRQTLLQLSDQFRARLATQGWNTGGSSSPIIPLIVGDPRLAMLLGAYLREHGFWAPGIRPPTVPEGESLVRLSLTAGHTTEQLDALATVLHGWRATQSLRV